MQTQDFTVPAGWYPDPLGLPQLRWWDNHAWTEHVSDARHPLVVQEPEHEVRPFAPSGDHGETRRERREREERERREREERARLFLGPLELTSPATDATEPAPPLVVPARHDEPGVTAPVRTDSARPEQAEPHPEATAPRNERSGLPDEPATRSPEPVAVASGAAATGTATAPAWVIALLPLVQLVASLLVVGAGAGTAGSWLLAAIWSVPLLASVGLAIADRRGLLRQGRPAPAPWTWSLAGPAAYLVARAIRLRGGFAPAIVWTGLALALPASALLVPGIVVAALPAAFEAEAEAAIADDASVMGARLTVDCPAPPPALGQEFTCLARDHSGDDLAIRVALDRSNGWVAWHVADWGVFTISR